MKKMLCAIAAIMLVLIVAMCSALAETKMVNDHAGLYSADEITQMEEIITRIRTVYQMDAVVLTTNDVPDSNGNDEITVAWADTWYEDHGCGLGEDRSGILLIIDMTNRYNYISTAGLMIDYMSDNRIEAVLTAADEYLYSGEYGQAMIAELNQLEAFCAEGIEEGSFRYDEATGEILTAPYRKPTTTEGDWEYRLLEDGTAEIVKYTGKEDKLVIPDTLGEKTVTRIGDGAFGACSLTSVTIPGSVTSIGHFAFAACSLTSVTIPDSVQEMGVNPFAYCEELTDIWVSPEHSYFATISGVLYEKTKKKLVCYPYAFTTTSFEIPQGITAIGDWAFYSCSSLKSVTIPDSVTSIGHYAFFACDSLTDVTIPDSVTSIGEHAFHAMDDNWNYVPIPNLTLTVPRDSYALQYCKDNNLKYTYPDANNWLFN